MVTLASGATSISIPALRRNVIASPDASVPPSPRMVSPARGAASISIPALRRKMGDIPDAFIPSFPRKRDSFFLPCCGRCSRRSCSVILAKAHPSKGRRIYLYSGTPAEDGRHSRRFYSVIPAKAGIHPVFATLNSPLQERGTSPRATRMGAPRSVIPAEAGIHLLFVNTALYRAVPLRLASPYLPSPWTPASAGVTVNEVRPARAAPFAPVSRRYAVSSTGQALSPPVLSTSTSSAQACRRVGRRQALAGVTDR